MVMVSPMTWEQRFAAAAIRGYFNASDQEAAGQWQTCAVGEAVASQSGAYELKEYVNNNRIYGLGQAFDKAVTNNRVEQARELYRAIREEVSLVR